LEGIFVKEKGRNGVYVPRFDLRARDTITLPDVIASGAFWRANGLGATMVRLRWDADNEWRSHPDIIASHKGVVMLDVSRHERKLRLDGVAVEWIQLTMIQPWIGVKRTKYHWA
jgi:hypothetical protein